MLENRLHMLRVTRSIHHRHYAWSECLWFHSYPLLVRISHVHLIEETPLSFISVYLQCVITSYAEISGYAPESSAEAFSRFGQPAPYVWRQSLDMCLNSTWLLLRLRSLHLWCWVKWHRFELDQRHLNGRYVRSPASGRNSDFTLPTHGTTSTAYSLSMLTTKIDAGPLCKNLVQFMVHGHVYYCFIVQWASYECRETDMLLILAKYCLFCYENRGQSLTSK